MGENMEANELAKEDDLDSLYAQHEFLLKERNRLTKIHKVRVRHLKGITTVLNKVVRELGIDNKGAVSIDLNDPNVLLQLLSKLPDEVIEVMRLLTDLTRDEIEDLDVAETILVFKEILEVNKRFFIQKVRPALDGFLGTVGLYLAGEAA